MDSQIGLLLALLLVTGTNCAPRKFGTGFRIGGESHSSIVLGGNGTIKRDGMLLSGEGNGLAAAKWDGGLYGGGYIDINNKTIAGRGALSSKLGGGAEFGKNGKFGLDKVGKIPFGLLRSVKSFKQAELGGNAEVVTGDDAKSLSHFFKTSAFDNPNLNFD